MKRILYTIVFACALVACNIEAPYITEAKGIEFEATEVMGTQMTVNCKPEDDRSYYYFSIMEYADYVNLNMTDAHFMTITLDSLYREYLDWRYAYLYNNEEYIMSFRNHSFHYGNSSRFFINLKPKTDYLIYGFTINPEDIQSPIGKLYTKRVQTTEVNNEVSPMVIDFRYDISNVSNTMQESTGDDFSQIEYADAIFSIRPSIDGKPTKDPYMVEIISDETLQRDFDGDIGKYADFIVEITLNGIITSDAIHRDIAMHKYYVELGKGYTIIAAAFRKSYRQALYYKHFTAAAGQSEGYSHEMYK